MAKVDTIAFDKTGTLTFGCLEICDIVSFDSNISELDILRLAASAEHRSEHPLGKAVLTCAKKHQLSLSEADHFKMITGKGIFAFINGEKIFCGSERYLTENGISLEKPAQTKLESFQIQGKASILIANDKRCIGIIALSDVLRSDAKNMVSSLSAMNTKTILLTGDHKRTAAYFAKFPI